MPTKAPEVFVPYSELSRYGIRYSRIHITAMVKAGAFPAPRQMSPNRVAWRLSDLQQWIDSRPPVRAPASAQPQTASAN